MSKMKVELNRAGVREVLKSAGVMGVLQDEAQRRAGAAGTGYGVNTHVGRNRCNAEIRAETKEARKDNLRNNTLLKVLS